MSRWFRFYDESLNDPKVLRLSDELYRAWTILLCLTSKNDGVLPSADDIAITLRMKLAKVCEWLTKLHAGELLDKTETGFQPHNWNGRQYKSDVSTERVKRFRNGQRNVSETPDETSPETEQKQITEKKIDQPSAIDREFEEFWEAYPRRDGANPKAPAAKLFRSAVKAGTPAADIISGARNCAVADARNIGTPYIPQAVKWLRDQRWTDYQGGEARPAPADIDWDVVLTNFKRFGHWSKHAGPSLDSPACRAPPDMLAKYGLAKAGTPVEIPSLKSMSTQ